MTLPQIRSLRPNNPFLFGFLRRVVDTTLATITKYDAIGRMARAQHGYRRRHQNATRYRKESGVEQRYAITVKFLVDADSAEDAEEMVETACEKAAAGFPEMSYEGIEDIEEEEEE